MFHFFIYFLLAVTVTKCWNFEEEFYSEPSGVKYIKQSTTGMPFLMNKTGLAVDAIYDCSIEATDRGTINVFDSAHPKYIKSLIIRNCYNVTVKFDCWLNRSMDGDLQPIFEGRFYMFHSIDIQNIEYLTLSGPDRCPEGKGEILFEPWKKHFSIHIKDVLTFNAELYRTGHPSYHYDLRVYQTNIYGFLKDSVLSLNFQNVFINTLDLILPPKISLMHLESVEIENIYKGAIIEGNDTVVTIISSVFKNIGAEAFAFDVSKVLLKNNTFHYIEDNAFSGNASDYFKVSDNYFKNIGNSFNVTSPSVQIVNNTFEFARTSWLKNFRISSKKSALRILNITNNILNFLPTDIFSGIGSELPDLISIKNNHLNCSCRTTDWAAIKATSIEGILSQILYKKENNNVCANYGNCDLSKLRNRIADVCSGTFVCPADDKEEILSVDNTDTFVKNTLQTIVSQLARLEDISEKLGSIGELLNSTILEKKNLMEI